MQSGVSKYGSHDPAGRARENEKPAKKGTGWKLAQAHGSHRGAKWKSRFASRHPEQETQVGSLAREPTGIATLRGHPGVVLCRQATNTQQQDLK